MFCRSQGQGAWLNGEPLAQRPPVPLAEGVALIDLKRLPRGLASRLASDPPYQSQRSFGAVALDWCWLAAGRCQVYLHGQQKLWDYAAGCLILRGSRRPGHNAAGRTGIRADAGTAISRRRFGSGCV